MPQIFGRELHPDDVQEAETLTAVETIRGIIFSFVFGYIATIPWIILSYLGWFVGWLGYLIGLGAIYGFIFGTQKINKTAMPVVVIVVLTAIPLAEFIGIAIVLLLGGRLPDPFTILDIAFFSDYSGSFYTSLLFGYIIAAAGAWSLIRSLSNRKTK